MALRGEYPYNLRKIQRDYVSRALSEQTRPKYLILDKFTMDSINIAFFKSELYQFHVFKTVSIHSMNEVSLQGTLDAVMIIRPTKENVDLIVQMLQQGTSFDTIHICSFLRVTVRFHEPNSKPSARGTSDSRHKQQDQNPQRNTHRLQRVGSGHVLTKTAVLGRDIGR